MSGWMRRAFSTAEYVEPEHVEQRTDPTFSAGDPGLAEFLGLSATSAAGVSVTTNAALGLSAMWRCVNLIAGTVASLPLKTHRRIEDPGGGRARKERVSSFLDNPDPTGMLTPYEWSELVLTHLLLAGNCYLLHVYGGAGQLIGLKPIVPSSVTVEPDDNVGKVFKVSLRNGEQREFTPLDLTHIPALSYDGIKGLSVISVARQSLGTAIAGDTAAGRMFANGLLLGGILTSKETLSPEQIDQVKAGFRARAQGVKNAGDVAFIPADLQFAPWSMSAEDAQFLESRHFGIEEVARWYGVPRELLSESGASSWGSGIQELVRAFARFTLASWTNRIESRLSALLPRPQFAEFDFSGLLQPSPEQEIELLIRQVESGLLTLDEARAIRNMPALSPAVQPGPSPQPSEVPA